MLKNKDSDIVQAVVVNCGSKIPLNNLFYFILKALCSLFLNYISEPDKLKCDDKSWLFDPKFIFLKVKNNDSLMEIYNRIVNNKEINAKMIDEKCIVIDPCQYIVLKNYIKRLRKFELR